MARLSGRQAGRQAGLAARWARGVTLVHVRCYRYDVERTTISLPEELLKRLRLLAAERGTSMAALIREALESAVASHHPRPRSLGIGASGLADTARRAGEERSEPRAWR